MFVAPSSGAMNVLYKREVITEMQGNIRCFFPGSNSASGFHSFYEHITAENATKIFVIKGGPGLGKSTLMRHIAESMVCNGFNAELHYCSSDPKSLDAVNFPDINVALLDGTAPHIVDPRFPGCVDEIINLGRYWDEKGIRRFRTEIVTSTREIQERFSAVYRRLAMAAAVKNDWRETVRRRLNPGELNVEAEQLIETLFGVKRASNRPGHLRHLFASAITPDGFVNHLQSVFSPADYVYALVGPPGSGKSSLLGKIAGKCQETGLSAEVFHCALEPGRIEHILIPDLKVGIITSIYPHEYPTPAIDEILDLSSTLDDNLPYGYEETVGFDSQLYWALLERTVSHLSAIKELHDHIETYYSENMHFECMTKLEEKILNQIQELASVY